MTPTAWLSIVSVIGSLVLGYFTFSNSRQTNRNRASEIQQSFTSQILADVATAKKDAADARADAAAARRDADATETQHRKLRREMAAMQEWVEGVIRARDRYISEFEASGKELTDTGAIRLLRAINGGPHIEE